MRYEVNCRSKDNSKVRYNTNTRKATAGRAKGEAMKNAAYYNGTISAIEDIKVPLEDRAVYFGDGVYDVAFCHNGKPFLIDEHFDRFYNSCRLVFPRQPSGHGIHARAAARDNHRSHFASR